VLRKCGSDQISEKSNNLKKITQILILGHILEISATDASPTFIYPSSLQKSKYYSQNYIAKNVFFVSKYVTNAGQIIKTGCP
jgi:hypothetical protein